MRILPDFKIGAKLLSAFLLLTSITLLVGFAGILGMLNLYSKIHDTQTNLVPSLVQASMIDRHTQQHRREFLHYLIDHSSDKRVLLDEKLAKEERQAYNSIEKILTYRILPEERQIFDSLTESVREYFRLTKELKKKVDSNAQSELIELENERIYDYFTGVEAKTKQFIDFNIDEITAHHESSIQLKDSARFWMALLLFVALGVSLTITILLKNSITEPINKALYALKLMQENAEAKSEIISLISSGDYSKNIEIEKITPIDEEERVNDETGDLLNSINTLRTVQSVQDTVFASMTESLRTKRHEEELRSWGDSGRNELNSIIRAVPDVKTLAESAISFICEYLNAASALFYIFNEEQSTITPVAGYAVYDPNLLDKPVKLGEGLAGEAALIKKTILLNDIPDSCARIKSGLGNTLPNQVIIIPLLHNDRLSGVMEFGTLHRFEEHQRLFLEEVKEWLAAAVNISLANQKVHELLEETQTLAEELQVQQEELQQSNEELEERAEMLDQQKEQIKKKNKDVEAARAELEKKAIELEKISSYKSQFLANMSHELRTPLNSMMILSSLLKENREKKLSDKQVEYASTINTAGRDLLNLINDILDLSKIEAGRMEFQYEEISIEELVANIMAIFRPLAQSRRIDFKIASEGAPEHFTSDSQRVQQVLKNLISNGIKFTKKGSVSLSITSRDNYPKYGKVICFDVADTGIGIAPEKQDIIFNAFQQADGSTSRTYGGTGLGLSISRELARSMGGDIILESREGEGSHFTLVLPLSHLPEALNKGLSQDSKLKEVPAVKIGQPAPSAEDVVASPVSYSSENVSSDGRTILIVEDDATFADILLATVRERGFNAVVATDGETGKQLAQELIPQAIILDVMLPGIDGWVVMRALKDNPATRHIPVHFITCLDERQKAMNMGAAGYSNKPLDVNGVDEVISSIESTINCKLKHILVVEDDKREADSIASLLESKSVSILTVETGSEAICKIQSQQIDCVVLDLGLSDMSAFEILEELKRLDPFKRIPVIIHTGRDLTLEESNRLRHYAESIIIKGAKSPERLLNEVTLFLHLVETSLEPSKQKMIRRALDKEAMLEGRKILIVDDDMRNIFSLSSALSEKDIIVYEAENGLEGIAALEKNPDIDLVLMDIMMPVMDGYETIRRIRNNKKYADLPIIALTAKAMKGDREECLTAGASDYIAKPLEIEKLFSMLRVWLYRKV